MIPLHITILVLDHTSQDYNFFIDSQGKISEPFCENLQLDKGFLLGMITLGDNRSADRIISLQTNSIDQQPCYRSTPQV